jgi:xylan 1,4-beta-xylosidase
VDALATAATDRVAVLTWYQVCDQYAQGERKVRVRIDELEGWAAAAIRHYRIDADHSNANTVWKSLGRPDWPTDAQIRVMKEREKLETIAPDMRVGVHDGAVQLDLTLPVHAVSLLLVTREW